MELSNELKTLLHKSFQHHSKWINAHIKEYEQNLLEVIKETDIKQEVDREFIFDLVEEGFHTTLVKYLDRMKLEIDSKREYMKQIKDILDA